MVDVIKVSEGKMTLGFCSTLKNSHSQTIQTLHRNSSVYKNDSPEKSTRNGPLIFEIYLNHVEWGTGVFGAEAAAQHYFKKSAKALDSYEASLLAVMLPAPKRYERVFATSGYLQSQAASVQARMGGVEIP